MAHDFEKKWRSEDVLVLENVDFSSMLLCDRVLAGLAKAGFKKPSPIQLEAIPTGRFGKDLLVQAKSGTGKTLVFVIVALEMFHSKILRPQVLILVPTREIATQICSVVKSVSSYFPKLTCESFIGGFPVADDIKKAHNCQIVVGTPGRLKQLIEKKALPTNSIRLVVFDEADEVLSFSWLEDIDFIFNSLPEDKQVIATSATFPPKLKRTVLKYLRDPYLAQIDTKKLALLGIIHYVKVVESSAMPIKQYRFKLAALEPILKNIKFTQCLVYCNGIHKVETLYRDIKKWGFSTTYISSNRDQAERLRAIDCLKRFKCKVLVTSNVTARGIDAENVDLVINFDVSNFTEIYLHRSGRAGRYGTKGATISIVDLFELKFIKKIEKEAHFKSYELPDPVPTDLIQNPVFDNYAIEVTNIENSNEIAEEQSTSVNKNDCPSETNFEQCDNQSNNLILTITDSNENDSNVHNGVSIPAHEESNSFLKKSCENNSSEKESRNYLKNCTVNEKSDGNTCTIIVDKLGIEKFENTSNKDIITLNISEQKISKVSKSNIYVSKTKNGITNVLDVSKNAESHDASDDTVETDVNINECYDKENAESLTCGNSNHVETGEHSDVMNVKTSAIALNECKVSELVNIKNGGKNIVHVSEKSCDIHVIESPLLSTNEEIVENVSKNSSNLSCQSNNSEIVCTKDSENSLISLNENSCIINDKKSSTSLTNQPDTEISVKQDTSSNSKTNVVQSMNDLDENKIKMAVKTNVRKYENMELTDLTNVNDSFEFRSSATENSVNKNISLNHISDLNSRRCDYYYKVFQLFQKDNSKQCESVKESLNKADDSSVEKKCCIQEPILRTEKLSTLCIISNEVASENINELKFESCTQEPVFCSELNSVKKATSIISNEAASGNGDELKFESSLQVPVQEMANKIDNNIPKLLKSPRCESTPNFEKSKLKINHLLDKGATESPERNIMAFFDEVSSESASETETYHEITHSDSSSLSSCSEFDSESCTDSSSSSCSISSSADDDSCDKDNSETSSFGSHSSVDSLSVHSIEYSCKRGGKSLQKYPHSNVSKQEKSSFKKHLQISHSECLDKRQQYYSKIHQNTSHSYDFFNNSYQHGLGANFSNAYEKPNQCRYSKIHQASSNGQHIHCKNGKNIHRNKSNFFQFSCNGHHSTACFMQSEHRCHPYHDSTPCNQRAICDQWYRIFCHQWQHIQNCSNIYF